MSATDNNKKSAGIFAKYQECESGIRNYLRRFIYSKFDIEDLCQETILQALEAEKRTTIIEPKAFLYGVTKNLVRKKLDKDNRSLIDFIEESEPTDHISDKSVNLEYQWDKMERLQTFRRAVSGLPEHCQRVFVLKKVYGFSHNEIAGELGISVSTVEKHVATGLKRCNEYMRLHAGKLHHPQRKNTSQSHTHYAKRA